MDSHGHAQVYVTGGDPRQQPRAINGQPGPFPQKPAGGELTTGKPQKVPGIAAVGQPSTGTGGPGDAPPTPTPPNPTPSAATMLDAMMDNPQFLGDFVQAIYAGDAGGVVTVMQKYGFGDISDADVDAIKNALANPVDQEQLRYIAGLCQITAPADLEPIPMIIEATDGSILCKPFFHFAF
jgi:hypothetical protein